MILFLAFSRAWLCPAPAIGSLGRAWRPSLELERAPGRGSPARQAPRRTPCDAAPLASCASRHVPQSAALPVQRHLRRARNRSAVPRSWRRTLRGTHTTRSARRCARSVAHTAVRTKQCAYSRGTHLSVPSVAPPVLPPRASRTQQSTPSGAHPAVGAPSGVALAGRPQRRAPPVAQSQWRPPKGRASSGAHPASLVTCRMSSNTHGSL